jgi:phage/plasmid-like protein (TIGR03299 family)
MSANIQENDKGILTGSTTWHKDPKYICVGNRPVTIEEAEAVVDIPIEKVPTYVCPIGTDERIKSGAYAVVRTDTVPHKVLAPSVGGRYEATPHRDVLNTFSENLLQVFPDLSICGTGTLENGRTWFIQMLAQKYAVKGDQSENELRLSYYQTYGKSAHSIFCSRTRIVCQNTLGFAAGDAIANKIMVRHKHTKNAQTKINAEMEFMAELKLRLARETAILDRLASTSFNQSYLTTFLDEFLPEPTEDTSTKSKNRILAARQTFGEILESGQSLDMSARYSRYAILNAFTDYIDHHSYSRNQYDRWLDSLNGKRNAQKMEALAYLSAA